MSASLRGGTVSVWMMLSHDDLLRFSSLFLPIHLARQQKTATHKGDPDGAPANCLWSDPNLTTVTDVNEQIKRLILFHLLSHCPSLPFPLSHQVTHFNIFQSVELHKIIKNNNVQILKLKHKQQIKKHFILRTTRELTEPAGGVGRHKRSEAPKTAETIESK